MKIAFYAVVLFCGTGCSKGPAPEQELIMREIESVVQLPAGAYALNEYSRNYALRPDGKVVGFYVLPVCPQNTGEIDCEIMVEDFTSRPCSIAEEAEAVAQEDAIADRFGQADKSRWFDDYGGLPMMDDGGCSFIEIIFDPQSKVVQSTRCNGEA